MICNTVKNVRRVMLTPGMLTAYLSWVSSKYLLNKPPSINCVNDTNLSGLASFSEYWTFFKGIPESEKRLMENSLNRSPANGIAIDIGANVGFFTVALGSIGYSQVHSFEPVPETFSILSKNIEVNGLKEKTVVNCLGVSDDEGYIEFKLFEKSPAINRLANSNDLKTGKTQKVSVVRLDDYCLSENIERIDFLKIDVEGMENLVLKGAQKLLSSQRVSLVLIEICPSNLSNLGFNVCEIHNTLSSFGYEIYRVGSDGNLSEKLSLSELEGIKLENVAAIPQLAY